MKLKQTISLVALLFLCASCANNPPKLSTFNEDLANLYQQQAEYCQQNLEQNCAAFFKYKAEEIKNGNNAISELPYSLSPNDKTELTKARLILSALLNKTSDTIMANPVQTARLHFYYECWLEQVKDNTKDVSNCRDNFHASIGKLINRIDEEKEFINYSNDIHSVYFILNHDKIEQRSIRAMQNLILELRKIKTPMQIVLYGYTDRVGEKPYNIKLAQRRIDAVKNILLNSGLVTEENITTKAYGENDPLINVDTIINNPHSRRVDIFLYRKDN